MPSAARLRLPHQDWQTMLDHVRACMPEEACGIVGGRRGEAALIRPVENAAHSPSRFRMEPRGQIAALLDLEAQGLQLLAVFHSHPSGPPGPSATDLADWSYPEAASIIWCCESGRWQARAFDLSGPAPVEVGIEILPARSGGAPRRA